MSYIVYKATGPTGLIYVGLTSRGLNSRRVGHLSDAMTRPLNIPFQNAIRKYGIDSFVWTIIAHKISSRADAAQIERHYIRYYQSNKKEFGYNRTSGGDGLDPEDADTINKIRNSVVSYYQSSEFNRTSHSRARGGVAISVFRGGRLVGTYPTQKDACDALGLSPPKVCICLKGLRPHHKGYTFEASDAP